MGTGKMGASQTDRRSKRKLLAACCVLLLATVWIIYYVTTMGGQAKGGPNLSETEKAALAEEHAAELKQIEKQTNEGNHEKAPAKAPSGS